MKRVFSTILVLLTLLALTTGTAFAGSALELVDVRNDQGGPTFIFRVTGEFSEGELNGGFVSVEGGEDYPLYCEQIDADTVVCHTSKKVGAHDVVVGFGGARFWVNVPDVKTYCYKVYGWNSQFPPTFPTDWMLAGSHCQTGPANTDDIIQFDFVNNSEAFGDYSDYIFNDTGADFLVTPSCEFNFPGDGYYYYVYILCS